MIPPAGGDAADAPRARPYTATSGRTEGNPELGLASLVRATGRFQPADFTVDHADTLALCHAPISVAEVAASTAQPAVVAKVVLSDLIEWGALVTRPLSFAPPEPDILERLLHGLQQL